jgi:opacity protein-like surface antigen
MRIWKAPSLAAAPLGLLLALPAGAADLYISGDIGISSGTGDVNGENNFLQLPPDPDPGDNVDPEELAHTIQFSSGDSSPVWGTALGIAFPLRGVMPWRMRVPEFGVPIWPGKRLSFGSEDFRAPEWETRFELQWLGGRDYELEGVGGVAVDGFDFTDPTRPYHAKIDVSSLMVNMRLDIPVQAPITALFGRLPILEPMTIFTGGGVGAVFQRAELENFFVAGDRSAKGFAWQFTAGIGYALTENVRWSVGYRFQDLGHLDFDLIDVTGTPRGGVDLDMGANEFTTSLKFNFWHIPVLDGE